MKLSIVSQGPTHCFAGLRNVLISLYWGTPTADALREREAWLVSSMARYRGIGLLVVVDPRAEGVLPDKEFRSVSKQQADQFRGRIHVSSSAIEGEGLKHSLVRTFLRSLAIVAQIDFPVRFFATTKQAATFAAELCDEPDSPTASELIIAVEEIRRVIDEAPAEN